MQWSRGINPRSTASITWVYTEVTTEKDGKEETTRECLSTTESGSEENGR